MGNVIKLRPSPWKHLAILVVCVGFVAIALFLMPADSFMKWFVVAIFGLGVVVELVVLLPGSSELRLDPDRMTVRSLFRTWHVRRADIAAFFVAHVGGQNMVCWDYTPESTPRDLGSAAVRAVTGVEAGLPDTYGRSAEELAGLLNQWLSGGTGTHPDNAPKPPLRGAA